MAQESPLAERIKRASPGQLIVVGALLLGLGLAAAMASPRGPLRILSLLCGGGLASLLYGIFRFGQSRLSRERQWIASVVAVALFALSVLAAAGAYGSYRYNKQTRRLCEDATGSSTLFGEGDSVEFRRAALAEAERRLASPFGQLTGRTLDFARHYCHSAKVDLKRQEAGQCPQTPIDGVPCRCGDRRWPDDTGCRKKPSCPWANAEDQREKFNCWLDY